jgi:hypothetical protein
LREEKDWSSYFFYFKKYKNKNQCRPHPQNPQKTEDIKGSSLHPTDVRNSHLKHLPTTINREKIFGKI